MYTKEQKTAGLRSGLAKKKNKYYKKAVSESSQLFLLLFSGFGVTIYTYLVFWRELLEKEDIYFFNMCSGAFGGAFGGAWHILF